MGTEAQLRDRVFVALTLGTAVAAPLFYGATSTRALCGALTALCVALTFSPLRFCGARHLRVLGPPVLVFLAYVAIAVAQATPGVLPPSPIWADAAPLVADLRVPTFSVDPDRTRLAIGVPLLLLAALLCGFGLAMRRGGSRRLLTVFAAMGTAYAVLGLVLHLAAPSTVLFTPKTTQFGSLTGTFFNRNTEAAFLGVCAVIQITLILERLAPERRPTGHLPSLWFEFRRKPMLLLLAGLAPVLVALAMTQSRAGVTLAVASMVFCGGLRFLVAPIRRNTGRRRWRRKETRGFILTFGAALGFFVVAIGGGGLGDRLSNEGIGDAARGFAYASSFRLIAQNPLLGHGIGTFELVYPAVRDPDGSILGVWNRAHSSLLEIAVEAGVPFAAVVMLSIAFVATVVTRAFLRRSDRPILPATMVVLAQTCAHSVVDYPLQIPAVGLVVAMLVGAALAAAVRVQERAEGRGKPTSATSNPASRPAFPPSRTSADREDRPAFKQSAP